MTDRELVHLLMEIKERLASIEAKQDVHLEQHQALKVLVSEHDDLIEKNSREILKAKTSLNTLRWVGGLLFFALPATAAAIAKVWRP